MYRGERRRERETGREGKGGERGTGKGRREGDRERRREGDRP